MWGRLKCLASARAMVPLPLAAGPSTAIRIRSGAGFSFSLCSFKRCALTGLQAYGKAPAARCRAAFEELPDRTRNWSETHHGEARMGRQAHLPQVLDPLLRPRQGRPGALHRMRQRMGARAGAEIEAAAAV